MMTSLRPRARSSSLDNYSVLFGGRHIPESWYISAANLVDVFPALSFPGLAHIEQDGDRPHYRKTNSGASWFGARRGNT
jgi:hypothetical protein